MKRRNGGVLPAIRFLPIWRLVLIFLAGGMAAMSMIRENFPEHSMDMITISVPYPGADPEEVEEGISRKIEDAIEGLEGVKQYTTQSSDNVGSAIVEVKENYDTDDVLSRIKAKVNSISTFPVDAEKTDHHRVDAKRAGHAALPFRRNV